MPAFSVEDDEPPFTAGIGRDGLEVPRLARFSGRDHHVLSQCSADEIRVSSMVGASLLVAATIHGAGMTAALTILNTQLPIAVAIACVTASGVLVADRVIIRAGDIAKGEAALRRIGAATTPRLLNPWARVGGLALRILFSLVVASVLACFIGLAFHDSDVRSFVEREQIRIDTPLIEAAEEQLDVRRAELMGAQRLAKDELDRIADELASADANRTARIEEAEQQRARLENEANDLRLRREQALAEAARQRDIARCELAGAGDAAIGCDLASGLEGEGPRYRLAVERAQEADARAADLSEQLDRVRDDLVFVVTSLETARDARTPDVAAAREAAEARKRQADADLSAFEEGFTNRAAEMIADDPLREVLDPESLAERINALGELSRNPFFLLSLIAIILVAIMLEMLAIIASFMLVPAHYMLQKGRELSTLSRHMVNEHLQDVIGDAPLHAIARPFREQRIEEDLDKDKIIRRMKRNVRRMEAESEFIKKKDDVERMRREFLSRKGIRDLVDEMLDMRMHQNKGGEKSDD